MARLLSRFAVSARAKQRARVISAILLGLVAAMSWWGVIEDGATPARVVVAVATSVAVLLDVLLPKRRRLLRRSASAPKPG